MFVKPCVFLYKYCNESLENMVSLCTRTFMYECYNVNRLQMDKICVFIKLAPQQKGLSHKVTVCNIPLIALFSSTHVSTKR